MKKTITLIFILFLGILTANAQVTFRPGIRAGLGLSTITGTGGNFRPDFYLGGFGQINLTKVYALQPELTYSRQGVNNAKNYYYNYDNDYNSTLQINYQDIKINHLSFAMINKFTFRSGILMQFGPTVEFLSHQNSAFNGSEIDLGFTTGVGYRLPSGLIFEVRFKGGIIDDFGGYESDYYDDINYNTNMTFQFGVAYTFGKK